MAAISGECGPCPISPTAKPAKPAPITCNILQMGNRHQLGLGDARQCDKRGKNVIDAFLFQLTAQFRRMRPVPWPVCA